MLFTTDWADACVFTYSLWARFANRFSTEKVKFVEINCSKFKTLAKSFKVNDSDPNQLPTLILLEDNVESLRFPPIDYKTGSIGKSVSFKEKELIKYFDLDKRFLATNVIKSQNAAGIQKKKANV